MPRKATGPPAWSTGLNRKPERVEAILGALRAFYPDARLILHFENPYQLLVAAILAAQATDERVNQVTPAVFRRYPTPRHMAEADPAELEALIRPTGYYRQKARFLIECCRAIVERFQGEVPDRLEDLTQLPGVGKKTAILVLNHAFQKPTGIVVDTHMHRVSQRLDWSHERDGTRWKRNCGPSSRRPTGSRRVPSSLFTAVGTVKHPGLSARAVRSRTSVISRKSDFVSK